MRRIVKRSKRPVIAGAVVLAGAAALAVAAFLKGDRVQVEPIRRSGSPQSVEVAQRQEARSASVPLQMNIQDTRFYQMYTPEEIEWFKAKVQKIADRLKRKHDIRKATLTVPKDPCSSKLGHSDARIRLITSPFGKKIDICLALVNPGESIHDPRAYWVNKAGTIVAHEYKHILDQEHLEFNPFTRNSNAEYIRRSREDLVRNGFADIALVEPTDESTERLLASAISEIRVNMRALPTEPKKPLAEDLMGEIILMAHNADLAVEGNDWSAIFLSEIYVRYMMESAAFRAALGITRMKGKATEAHEKLRQAREKLTEDLRLQAMYNELFAQARLAEQQRFRMQE